MANIYGRSTSWGSYRNTNYDDQLIGTASGDWIDGLGGNDNLFAGFGNDTVYGGSGNDTIFGSDTGQGRAAWGNDWVSGGAGSDTLVFSQTTSAVTLNGDAGADVIYGGSNNDSVWGGSEDDIIFGGVGHDQIVGGTGQDDIEGESGIDRIWGDVGVDTIDGGSGNDLLVGGADADWLQGGSGADTFLYGASHSGLTWETADTILDFRPYEGDRLDFAVAGNQFNYTETWLPAADFDTARDWAASQIDSGARYAFVGASSGTVIQNYLFADANGDGSMETGIELLGNYNSFNYTDII